MQETPEERKAILDKMQAASDIFYSIAVAAGCHAFIEFTGLLNEHIKICREAENSGIEWVRANVHGDTHLPFKPHNIKYINEKLECIYGRGLASVDDQKQGIQFSVNVIKKTQERLQTSLSAISTDSNVTSGILKTTNILLNNIVLVLEEFIKEKLGGAP